ncbi:hypothetical protein NDU88_001353 [Pleurodeles waltl]|uniref:Uncharacterized protein n=1 Tax=Pleurodeles waltl TaxID=8319 RepID=A0AAV7S7U0_PLEWA|nr:hypothetical protein NDU88_001353 [Pleurodeles waltl]
MEILQHATRIQNENLEMRKQSIDEVIAGSVGEEGNSNVDGLFMGFTDEDEDFSKVCIVNGVVDGVFDEVVVHSVDDEVVVNGVIDKVVIDSGTDGDAVFNGVDTFFIDVTVVVDAMDLVDGVVVVINELVFIDADTVIDVVIDRVADH